MSQNISRLPGDFLMANEYTVDDGSGAMAISKEFILGQGKLPQNSLRKPTLKKGATNLRAKGSQYNDLVKALDLLLDGPSIKDHDIIEDPKFMSNQLLA